MRAPRIIVRAALVCGATGIALGVWAASDDHAAHAADKPPAAEQPGDLLGATARLPEQAADRAKQVVAKVTAEPEQSEPGGQGDDPAPGDEPAPVEDRAPDPAPPVDSPVELPPVLDPPPVVVDPAPVELPPVELPPVEVPPLPAPPVELPPAPLPLPTTPADLRDTPVSLPATAPAVVPGALPVVLGSVPAAVPPPPAAAAVVAVSDTAAQVIPCETSHNHAAQGGRDNADRQTGKPSPSVHDRKPCQPQRPATDTTGPGQVKPPPPSAAETIAGDIARSHVPPVLGRLEHVRPRSTIPAGRTTHLDPRPA